MSRVVTTRIRLSPAIRKALSSECAYSLNVRLAVITAAGTQLESANASPTDPRIALFAERRFDSYPARAPARYAKRRGRLHIDGVVNTGSAFAMPNFVPEDLTHSGTRAVGRRRSMLVLTLETPPEIRPAHNHGYRTGICIEKRLPSGICGSIPVIGKAPSGNTLPRRSGIRLRWW